jgi:hypothetical protein
MFDVANLTTFKHLLTMIRHGKVVRADGRNAYLTKENAGRYLNVPVSLIQGERNTIFRPRGGDRSITWLKANGPHPDAYQLTRIPNYGHLDIFIGRDSARQTYPVLLDRLLWGARKASEIPI